MPFPARRLLADDIREHLRRKHYHVQCNRCCLIFKVIGDDRAAAIAELKKHQRRDEICEKNPESEIEGLSDDHWLKLDQTRQSKKGKSSSAELPKSEVGKWMDIWKILFPEIKPPATPCKKSRRPKPMMVAVLVTFDRVRKHLNGIYFLSLTRIT